MLIAYTRSSSIYDDSRATKEISAFLEQGYKVAVYGWDRIGGSLKKCEELFKEYASAVSFSFYNGKTGKKAIDKIIARYCWNNWLEKQLIENRLLDAIHACDFDTGIAARRISKKMRIEYVYDIFDYYADAHPVFGPLKKHVEKKETEIINEAAVTIICTEERIEQIKESKPKKLVVIHNSPDVPKNYKPDIVYDYAYCGTMNEGRLIEEILSMYSENNELDFVYAGRGKCAKKAEDLARNNKNFTYLGSITYNEVIQIESRAKVLSAVYNPINRNHRLCAPNKFYEAMALGKPVIVCRGTGIDKVVQDNKIGIVINYDADDFYTAIKYLKDNDDLREEMGKRGRRIYEEKYMWSIMKTRLLEVYDQLEMRVNGNSQEQ